MRTHTFGELFKLFRLRAGIETLSSFANMMAEHGMVYENSLYSRWQRNERIPRDRKVLLLVAKILNEHKGITSKDEVNLLLESVDQRELTDLEEQDFTFEMSHGVDELLQNKSTTMESVSQSELNLWRYFKTHLLSSRIAWLIGIAFLIQSVLFYWIWNQNLFGTVQSYVSGYAYGYIALIGISYGLRNLHMAKNRDYTGRPQIIRWLCLGLLSQFIGLQIWTAYNLQGVEVPYPSIADFGYFGLIPCYTYVALWLAAPSLSDNLAYFIKRKGLFIFTPILFSMMLILFYFITTYSFSVQSTISNFFDIIYPLGEALPMTLLLYALVLKTEKKVRVEKINSIIILVGFFLQFLAEYSFIFSAKLESYVNTGFIDYIYCISYTYMALTIVMLTNVNKLYNPNTALEEATSSKHNPNSSRLLSSYNPIQN